MDTLQASTPLSAGLIAVIVLGTFLVIVIVLIVICFCCTDQIHKCIYGVCSTCKRNQCCGRCRCCLFVKKNYLFYTNQLKSKPDDLTMDEMLSEFRGDYRRLEEEHGFIQWLFPTIEEGLNHHAQALSREEISEIKQCPEAKARFVAAYEMMLDFYGLQLVNRETGQVQRAANYKTRYHNITRHSHNYLRITRIIKSQGLLGFEHYQGPFVELLLREVTESGLLSQARESLEKFWIPAVKNEHLKYQLKIKVMQNMDKKSNEDAQQVVREYEDD